MFWIENLSLLKSQATKKYLDLTCVIFHLSGIKTLINPKDLINDINYSLSCSFRVKIPMQILYLKTLKFLSLLTRLPLKTAFLLQNFKGFKLSYVFNSWLKRSFESQSYDTKWTNLCCLKIPSCGAIFNDYKCNICLELSTKLPSYFYFSSIE